MKVIDETMKIKEENQKRIFQLNMNYKYPDCYKCKMYQVLNLKKQKAYCPYMQKKGCVLK